MRLGTWLLLAVLLLLAPTASAADQDIHTALDPWIPFLVWGGLCIWCLYLTGNALSAYFPAAMALLNLANRILPTPLWGLPAEVMLFAPAIFIHAIIVTVRDLAADARKPQKGSS